MPLLNLNPTPRIPARLTSAMAVLAIVLTLFPAHAAGSARDTAYTATLERFSRLPGVASLPGPEEQRLLRELSYTEMRAFRAICSLPAMTREVAARILRELPARTIRYQHVPLLEKLVAIDSATVDDCWRLLDRLQGVDFVSGKVLAGLANVATMTVADLFRLIERVDRLDEPGRWAAGGLFSVRGIAAAEVTQGLDLVESMGERQRWAAEQQCRIRRITPEEALAGMAEIRSLSASDAWNARSLFTLPEMTAKLAASWLNGYFRIPEKAREQAFRRMPDKDKTLLLQVFASASDYPLWQINNLHDITDNLGREIGSGTLSGYSGERLLGLMHRLHPLVQQRFGPQMRRLLAAGDRGGAIATLRQATAAARKQTAADLTSANIYVLLAYGSDLYDSSFRDILVPVLKNRIAADYGDDLLSFLVATDPESIFASDCIASLAQKGKLTVFFPPDPERQKKVLDLVARSALQNEFSLILFSATFSRLLETIDPPARSYLTGLLLDAARRGDNVFSRQVRIILQYYLNEYPELLAPGDKIRIAEMLAALGAIDLAPFTRTPFAEWRSDGSLRSLSVFQDDDDGRSSFLSNCRTLLAGGYRPQVSSRYPMSGLSASAAGSARAAVQTIRAGGDGLGSLLRLSIAHPLVIDWTRTVSGIEIAHSVFVYQGKTTQQQLLALFLKGGSEMFAQRGHSYWRRDQLIDPLKTLLERGTVTASDLQAKQRFLSIGSCGGIRAYSELNRIFHNHVDILATIGTGKTTVNNPYNQQFFEIIAKGGGDLSWEEVARRSAGIFRTNHAEDYLQPGSLPAILHKIMDLKPQPDATDQTRRTAGTAR
jgi:hypothetical protein